MEPFLLHFIMHETLVPFTVQLRPQRKHLSFAIIVLKEISIFDITVRWCSHINASFNLEPLFDTS